MALFLAKFKLVHVPYMNEGYTTPEEIRLVEATCETTAEDAVYDALEVDDTYGKSIRVADLEITSTIIAKV